MIDKSEIVRNYESKFFKLLFVMNVWQNGLVTKKIYAYIVYVLFLLERKVDN